jgi:bifunctional DNase/RNase
LKEKLGDRFLSSVIGHWEAEKMAQIADDCQTEGHSTYELMSSIIKSCNLTPEAVFIQSYKDGIFYTEINFKPKGKDYETLIMESRLSDAIIISMMFKCPIYANERVFEKNLFNGGLEEMEQNEREELLRKIQQTFDNMGMMLDESDKQPKPKPENLITLALDVILEDALEEAVKKEEYAKAEKLKDIIDKLNSKKGNQ